MSNFEEDQTDNKLSILDNNNVKMDNLLSKMDNYLIYQNIDDTLLKCVLCNRVYKYLSGLCKHKKQKHPNYNNEVQKLNYKQNIKINKKSEVEENELNQVKQILIEQTKQIENLDKKNKELELLVKTSKTKKIINNTNTNTTNTNNGQIINNNFNIVSFGDEDIDKLTQEEILYILKSKKN